MPPHVVFIGPFEASMFAQRNLGALLRNQGARVSYISFKSIEAVWGPPIANEVIDPEYNRGLRYTPAEEALLLDLLDDLQPTLIGLTVTSTVHGQARALTRTIKKRFSTPVIWGGADAVLNPDLAIEAADMVCIGEGEPVIGPLLEAVATGREPANIAGIWWKRNGEVQKNPPCGVLSEMDALPPADWSLQDYYYIEAGAMVRGKWHPHSLVQEHQVITMSGRGCPMRCSYCINGSTDPRVQKTCQVRRRSVEQVIAELKSLKKTFAGLEQFYFADEIFTNSPGWLHAFAEQYAKEIAIPFVCYTYPGTAKKAIFEDLSRMGCKHVIIGIQSGSDRTNRELYGRNARAEQVLQTARQLLNHGIPYYVELIVGNPLEQEDDYRQTLNLLLQLPRPYYLGGCYTLAYFRGHAITTQAEQQSVELQWDSPALAHAPEKPAYVFWRSLFQIAAASPIPRASLEALVSNAALRQNPTPLRDVAAHMESLLFTGGTRVTKADHIENLQKQLQAWKESRFLRAAQKCRNWLRALAGKPRNSNAGP